MKIKKVDDKPMVIHTKKKSKLHRVAPRNSAIKGRNVYSVERRPDRRKKNAAVKNLRGRKKKRFNFRRRDMRKDMGAGRSPAAKKRGTLYNTGMIGAKTVTDQMEGGQELEQSVFLMYEAGKPVTGTVSMGADLFKQKVMAERKQRIKMVDAREKLTVKMRSTPEKAFLQAEKGQAGHMARSARRTAKDTAGKTVKKAGREAAKTTAKETAQTAAKATVSTAATAAGTAAAPGAVAGWTAGKAASTKIERDNRARDTRMRKIRFFLDKMQAEERQKDSLANLVKDLIFQRAGLVTRQIAAAVLPFLLAGVLLIAMTAIPVVAVVGTLYNSPFAVFLPALQEGDTIQNVLEEYLDVFYDEVQSLAEEHEGYDEGEIIYVDYEGYESVPSNYYDILAVYMVRYGIGDTATVVNDTTKGWLQGVVDDMCSYTVSTETVYEEVEEDDGSTSTKETTILQVNVTLLSWRDMVDIYGFHENEQELLAEFMSSEYLAILGYTASGVGTSMQVSLSTEERITAVESVPDSTRKTVVSYALSRVGYPYSQSLRDSGTAYDCSSLAYYAWMSAGVSIAYGGSTTAAAEAQGLLEAGKITAFDEMRPGDLIFYSTSNNGRFMNITHVAVYVGDGKVVEALNETYGVVYQDVRTDGILLIGSPE